MIFKLDGYPVLDGVLADLAWNYIRRAHMPVPKMAYLSAVMFGATVCSRYYTFKESYSNLYSILCAPSGSGKNDVITLMSKWAYDCSAGELTNVISGFTSDAAVQSSLVNNPQQCVIIDEYGKVVSGMVQNPSARTAISTLTSVFSSAERVYHSKAYSDNGKGKDEARKKSIVRPALSIIGVGEESQLRDVITYDNISDGTIARYLFWWVDVQECLDVTDYIEANDPLNSRAVKRIQEILSIGYDVETNEIVNLKSVIDEPQPEPAKPCVIDGSDNYLNDMRNDYKRKAYLSKDDLLSALYNRVVEIAKRISITFELLNTPYDKQVPVKRSNTIKIHQETLSQAVSIVLKSIDNYVRFLEEQNILPYHPSIMKLGDWIINYFNNNPAGEMTIDDLNILIKEYNKSNKDKIIEIAPNRLNANKSNSYVYSQGVQKYAGTLINYLSHNSDIIYDKPPILSGNTNRQGKFFYINRSNKNELVIENTIQIESDKGREARCLVYIMDFIKKKEGVSIDVDEARDILNDKNHSLDRVYQYEDFKIPE